MAIAFSTILNIIFCKYITDSNTSKDRNIDINIIIHGAIFSWMNKIDMTADFSQSESIMSWWYVSD